MGYIYLTTNLVNGKKYIGQCRNKSEETKHYLGSGTILKEAIKKYKRINFFKEILIEGNFSQSALNELEKAYITKYDAVRSSDFYNILPGGNSRKGIVTNELYPIVYQYNCDGKILNIFDGVTATCNELSIKSLSVYSGIWKNSYNNKLKCYFTNDVSQIIPRSPIYKAVDVYSKKGELYLSFDTINDCARHFNIDKAAIAGAIKRKGTCCGYHIVFKGELPTFDEVKLYYLYDRKGTVKKTITCSRQELPKILNLANSVAYEALTYNQFINKLKLFLTDSSLNIKPRPHISQYNNSSKPLKKDFYFYDVEGNLAFKRNGTILEISSEFGVSYSTFSAMLSTGNFNNTVGYFVNTTGEKPNVYLPHFKTVFVYDENMKFVEKCSSIIDCTKKYNISKPTLRKYLNKQVVKNYYFTTEYL